MRVPFGAFTPKAFGAKRLVAFVTSLARSQAFVFAQAPGRVFIAPLAHVMPMKHRFTKHYTRDEARALLPQIRRWLERLAQLRQVLERLEKRLETLMKQGRDTGGQTVNEQVRTLADVQEILGEFQRRQIIIKDLDRGLVDFPAIIGGKEIFLCWEQDEEDVEFWHDLESGYGGRERL
jgi:hypothetical protein